MPTSKPQARFFLRGSALIFLFLVMWWFALLGPLLYLLQAGGELAGSLLLGRDGREFIAEAPSGDWSFRVPMEATVPKPPPQTGSAPIHSVDFDMKRSDVLVFTFSLPVFWALMLAAPRLRNNLPALLRGTLIMLAIELALLLAFAEISARNIVAQLAHPLQPPSSWPLRFADYLTLHVLPFASPFVIAVSLHAELRSLILGWEMPAGPRGETLAPVPVDESARTPAAASRGDKRRKRKIG